MNLEHLLRAFQIADIDPLAEGGNQLQPLLPSGGNRLNAFLRFVASIVQNTGPLNFCIFDYNAFIHFMTRVESRALLFLNRFWLDACLNERDGLLPAAEMISVSQDQI